MNCNQVISPPRKVCHLAGIVPGSFSFAAESLASQETTEETASNHHFSNYEDNESLSGCSCSDINLHQRPVSDIKIIPEKGNDLKPINQEPALCSESNHLDHPLTWTPTGPFGSAVPSSAITPLPQKRRLHDLQVDDGPCFGNSPVSKNQRSSGQRYTNPSELRLIDGSKLINEVRASYPDLLKKEQECVYIDKEHAMRDELTDQEWHGLSNKHKTLLWKYYDFMIVSHHPSANSTLQSLAKTYFLPARMWRYGIHSLLEIQRERLHFPVVLEYMISFIHLAYSIIILLLERVPQFTDIWMESLGDLARYRMAVGDQDPSERDVWAGVARSWYNKAADRSPSIGRIQHHLAVLARPNLLVQLFYYTKSLVGVQPFSGARESIMILFNPLLDPSADCNKRYPTVLIHFVTAHALLFARGSAEHFLSRVSNFQTLFTDYIDQAGKEYRELGVYLSSANFAAMFEYGHPDGLLHTIFRNALKETDVHTDRYQQAKDYFYRYRKASTTSKLRSDSSKPFAGHSLPLEPMGCMSIASHLAWSTLSLALDYDVNNKNLLPMAHVSLAFLWCLALVPESMCQIEMDAPWTRIASLLNHLVRSSNLRKKPYGRMTIESPVFPGVGEDKNEKVKVPLPRQLPEDIHIRGQVWSQKYYPMGFFGDVNTADGNKLGEEGQCSIELPSVTAKSRERRCLWLGVRLASVCSLLFPLPLFIIICFVPYIN